MQPGFGLTFNRLYAREGLVALDARFAHELAARDALLHNRLVSARAHPDALPDKEHSQLIIDLAPPLEDFLAELFNIRTELTALKENHFALAPLYACKRLFVQRKAAKTITAEQAQALDGKELEKKLLNYFSSGEPSPLRGEGGSKQRFEPGEGDDPTLAFARELRKESTEAEKLLWERLRANRFDAYKFRRQQPMGDRYIVDFVCLEKKLIIAVDGSQHAEERAEHDKTRTQFLEKEGYRVIRFWNNQVMQETDKVLEAIRVALEAPSPGLEQKLQATLPPQGGGLSIQDFELTFARHVMQWLDAPEKHEQQLRTALHYAAWALLSDEGKHKHAKGILFKMPRKLDPHHLIPLETHVVDGVTLLKLPAAHRRARHGFALTDDGGSLAKTLDETNYCIWCHNQDKDSCSKGLKEKDGKFKKSALGGELTGCPLGEKISEMNFLKSEGIPLGALAAVIIDNPMCAGTGHRICNDCMKSCIYQKQEPVNIPQAETRTLRDVLALPWGFEIYSLLTRWNPLNLHRPLPKPATGRKVLIAGLGPAGYTLAHHLMNDGHTVVGIDGLKIEPLPESLCGVTALGAPVPFEPIRDIHALLESLDKRTLAGFGGVAEYGITVRWDKNFLKVIRLLLERRREFAMMGGVRFGGTITIDSAWELGFDHIALCMGAGKPTLIDMPHGLARGVRAASDFLMALQLTGAAKEDSIANLQLRLPVVVIGGGLTAIDTSTEALAYYPVQVEKFLARYEALGPEARARWSKEDAIIAEEFIAHAKALREERKKPKPDIAALLEKWGGVKMVYRKRLIHAPSYRLNHEEVEKALEESITIAESLEPVQVEVDEFRHAKSVTFKHAESSNFVTLPARTVLVAAGTNPNITLAHEDSGHVHLHGKYFRAVDENGNPVTPQGSPKPDAAQVLLAREADGRAISFFGDLHPSFAGNVVKAMASAKQGYPVVSRVLAERKGESRVASREFLQHLNTQLRATVHDVVRLNPRIVEVIVNAPLASKMFEPGQFYRLQNFEAFALKSREPPVASRAGENDSSRDSDHVTRITTLAMEGLAMTGAWVDKEKGLLSTIVLEMGGSSDLCACLKKGEPVVLMGPTGTATEIPAGETFLLAGGGLGNAVLFSIGSRAREKGGKVLYFAGYKEAGDRYKAEEIEKAADVVVWCCDTLPGFTPTRPQDKAFHGNIVQAMLAYAEGKLGTPPIPVKNCDRLIAIGSDAMMAAVASARSGPLGSHLKPGHKAIASINSPMQCMMKEICAQCLQLHIDPATGAVTYIYSCNNQDQAMDCVSFPFLAERLKQNALSEKLTAQWIHRCLEALGKRKTDRLRVAAEQ